ncbi:MAG: ATP-binding protein [Ignavibacteriales bacterium]|nr:ATP-binding protein [Ignavibacteriales bacterium]
MSNEYNILFEKNPSAILLIDSKDFSIKEVNNAACKFYGYSKNKFQKLNLLKIDNSLTGKPHLSILHHLKKKQFYAIHSLKNGTRCNVEINSISFEINDELFFCLIVGNNFPKIITLDKKPQHKSKSEAAFEERISYLKNENLQLEEKIKKEKSFEKKLKNQLSYLQTLIDTVANPIFIKDKNKLLIDCNSSFEKYFDLQRKLIKGRDVFNIFPADVANQLQKIDEDILKDGLVKVAEIFFNENAENQKSIMITENLLYNDDRSIAGFVCVLIDITEIKQMEVFHKNAFEKEKQLNELKSRFLSTASHEFRTPLTTILTSSELLAMIGRTCKEEKYLEQIIKIQNAVVYMTGLLDDILTINKTDLGKWEFNPSIINLHSCCIKMVEEIYTIATPGHNIIFNYLLKDKHAIVDEKLLQHIISNLLSNAVKYSPNGGDVIFKVVQSHSNIEFIVSDNGIGIAEQDQKNLFETFYRGKNTINIPGTGLGLSIVKRSVESHGGKISYRSKLNEGTVFVVSIPLMTTL